MKYWWVNQNQTYKHEVTGGFLWSPKTTSSGSKNPFYDNMLEVKPGDIVFSFCDTRIKAIGLATGIATSSIKPNFGARGVAWANEGWFVPVEFAELSQSIRPKDNIAQLLPFLPKKYSPLRANGDGLQNVYLAFVPELMANVLKQMLGDQFDSTLSYLDGRVIYDDNDKEVVLAGASGVGPTTKEQIVQARRGQGVFKANVRLNESRCRVTGINNPSHLIASHIKPWRECTDQERLHGSNGLLLAPHIDHLFDKGYITFTERGELCVSDRLDVAVSEAWAIKDGMSVGSFNEDQKRFLEFHRNNIFRCAGK